MVEPAVILLVALAGGALPLLMRWGDRRLHSALALSTGIFLGAVFLHLLPEVASISMEGGGHAHGQAVEAAEPQEGHAPSEDDPHAGHDHAEDEPHVEDDPHAGHDHAGHDHAGHDHAEDDPHAGHDHAEDDATAHAGHNHGDYVIWAWVLLGVLMVNLAESLVLRSHDHDDVHRHTAVGWATLMGIGVHALTAGLGLAGLGDRAMLGTAFFMAFLAHKAFETFSLVTVFQLAKFPQRRIIVTLSLFALVTPLGMLAGNALIAPLGSGGMHIVTALAAGTFLYVCIGELLPEVFHHKEDSILKILLLAVGVALAFAFEAQGI